MRNETFSAFLSARDSKHTATATLLQNKLVMENLGLVSSYAHRVKFATNSGAEKADLVQAGAIGLRKALDDFDPKKGMFSTHAMFKIKSEVLAVVAKAPVVSIPRSATGVEVVPVCVEAEAANAVPCADESAHDVIERAEDLQALTEALQTLTSIERRVVKGLLLQEKSYRQVAASLGRSQEYVRQIKNSALEKLRALFADR